MREIREWCLDLDDFIDFLKQHRHCFYHEPGAVCPSNEQIYGLVSRNFSAIKEECRISLGICVWRDGDKILFQAD